MFPNTFNLYNIPAAALAGLGGQNIQQLINQLISSGGINQAGRSPQFRRCWRSWAAREIRFSASRWRLSAAASRFMGLSLDQLAATFP